MSVDSKKEFIACIKKSGVIDADRLTEWLEVASGEEPKDLAKQLVRDHLLTKWQAKYLMSGRSRLDIGSYRLLERTSRDELGDRFLAVHTSLARKVDLQVLPSKVTKDKSRIKAFLKKASQVGKLDHPNLIHVYDIDQEGGRFFLVTEFVEGKTLDQVARTRIDETDIARILSQSIVGLTHAHQHGVIHGSLTQNDLVLVKEDIKIQNLAVSPLREKSTSEVTDDFEAIKNIGKTLLGEIPESKRTEKHAELTKLLSELEPESTDSISLFGDSLAVWIGAPSEDSEFNFTDPFAVTGPATGGFDQPIASALPTRKKKKPSTEEAPEFVEEAQPAGMLGKLWKDNPIAVIATAGVLALMLVGGSAYGAFALLSGGNEPVAKKAEFKSDTNLNNTPVGNKEPVDFSDEEQMKNLIDAQFKNGNDPAKNKLPAEKANPKKGEPKKSNKNPPGKNNGNAKNLPTIADATTYKFPRLKSECSVGPQDKKVKIPAETAIKTISPQSSEGWIEIEAVLADKSKVKGWIESKFIYDGPEPTQTVVANDGAATKTDPPKTVPGKTDPTKTELANVDPKPEVPVVEVADNLTTISGIGEKTQTVLYGGDVQSFKKLASMSGEEVRDALKKGGKTVLLNSVEECEGWIRQAKKLVNDTSPIRKTEATSTAAGASPPKANPTNPNVGTPFEKFPRVTELPPVEDTTEKRIAPLVINQSYLLGAEIISDPAICKTRVIFELNRDVEDKQKWVVGVKRRPKEKPTELAVFRKSRDAFFFQWLPEAENNKYSEFLRNCFIKLKTPDDQATYLTLRPPIVVPDPRLTADSLENGLEIMIPAMPDPDSIVIEVLPVHVPGLQLDTVVSVIERGSPGRIMLIRGDSKGFMWIQVAAELKSKLKIQTNVLARYQNKIVPIVNMKEVGNFVGTLRQAENIALMANQQKQKQVPKKNEKTALDKEKAQFQSFANQAKANTNKAIQYQGILAKSVNQPITIRVYAKFGSLRTTLIETDPKLPQPTKKKKR